jgi:hypothetical protein
VRVNIHAPEAGNPVNIALPVAMAQVGWVMAPAAGADGPAFTFNVYKATAGEHGVPD